VGLRLVGVRAPDVEPGRLPRQRGGQVVIPAQGGEHDLGGFVRYGVGCESIEEQVEEGFFAVHGVSRGCRGKGLGGPGRASVPAPAYRDIS
jgi:hypothetical protein